MICDYLVAANSTYRYITKMSIVVYVQTAYSTTLQHQYCNTTGRYDKYVFFPVTLILVQFSHHITLLRSFTIVSTAFSLSLIFFVADKFASLDLTN